MAIWNVSITPLDVARKEASITATRTDGEDVQTFNIITALLTNRKQKQDVIDQIWSQYLAAKAKKKAGADFIGKLETEAKTALEARKEA